MVLPMPGCFPVSFLGSLSEPLCKCTRYFWGQTARNCKSVVKWTGSDGLIQPSCTSSVYTAARAPLTDTLVPFFFLLCPLDWDRWSHPDLLCLPLTAGLGSVVSSNVTVPSFDLWAGVNCLALTYYTLF